MSKLNCFKTKLAALAFALVAALFVSFSAQAQATGVKFRHVPVGGDVHKLVFSAMTPSRIGGINIIFSFDNTVIRPIHRNGSTEVTITDEASTPTTPFQVVAETFVDEITPPFAFNKWRINGSISRTAWDYAIYTTPPDYINSNAIYVDLFEFYFKFQPGMTISNVTASTFKFETAADPANMLSLFFTNINGQAGIILDEVLGSSQYRWGHANTNGWQTYTTLLEKVENPFAPTIVPLDGTATISNMNPRIGDVLTGSRTGGSAITGTLSYTWKTGATTLGTGASYTVPAGDLGNTITLEITSSVETGTLTSAATAAVLKKAAPAAPAAPTLASKTHNSITLTANAAYEFSMDGTNWQTGNVFGSLSSSTAYTFYQRVAETADTYASLASGALNESTLAAPLTGTATIDNTNPRIGELLTGSLAGGNNTGTLTYQWKADGSPVGSNSATYTVVLADLGKTITLEVTSSIETGTVTSAGTSAVLKKIGPPAPVAPVVVSIDHNTVTLTANALYEFSRDGTNWQTNNVFTGLTPSTLYGFYQRVAETGDTEASVASSVLNVTTDNPPPGALTGTPTISNMSPRIGDVLNGSLAGGNNSGTLTLTWKTGATTLGTGASYTVLVTDLGNAIFLEITSSVETGTLTSASTAAVLKKTNPAVPSAPTVDTKTATSVTLNTVAGHEYSSDASTWQDAVLFSSLLPSTAYSFYQRVKETADTYASINSQALSVTTDKAALGGTVSITGTTKFGQVLTADVSLLSSTPSVTPGALTCVWKSGGATVGANQNTYLLVAADIGQIITVTVSAANCTGEVTSAPTAAIAKADGPAAPATVTGSYTGDGTTFTYTVTAPTGTQYEYSSDNWATKQTSPVFTGFTTASPATTFSARVAETATTLVGASGNTGAVTFVKLANPTAPALNYTVADDPADVTNPAGQKDKLITITPVAGAEYSFNGGVYGAANAQGGFAFNATVTIAIRFAETGTHSASNAATATVNLANAEQPAPAAFTLTFTLNGDGVTFTATIPAVAGGEYSFDGTNWGAANTKTDCLPNTSYTGYVRLAAITGFNASPVTSDTKTSPMLVVATPVISPNGGSFTGSQTVTITCATGTAAIYYTTDGTAPDATGAPYTAPFNIVATTTVRAIAIAPGMTNSAVATATFTLGTVTPPVTGTVARITGPAFLTLKTGYKATSVGAYTVTGSSPVTVAKVSGDSRITWNNDTRMLDIAEGLPAGSYTVILRAQNSVGNSSLTFTLTVENPVFWIEIPATFDNGRVTVNPLYVSEAGKIVTLTVTPNAGYVLESLVVHKLGDPKVTVPLSNPVTTRSLAHTCTFTMPAFHINVAAVFKSDATSVDDVQQNALQAYAQGGKLYVNGLVQGTAWNVYNTMGSLVYQGVASSDKAEVGLPGRGVYIVTDGKTVVKVTN